MTIIGIEPRMKEHWEEIPVPESRGHQLWRIYMTNVKSHDCNNRVHVVPWDKLPAGCRHSYEVAGKAMFEAGVKAVSDAVQLALDAV